MVKINVADSLQLSPPRRDKRSTSLSSVSTSLSRTSTTATLHGAYTVHHPPAPPTEATPAKVPWWKSRPRWRKVSNREWKRDFENFLDMFYSLPYKTFWSRAFFFSSAFYPDMVSPETYERYVSEYDVVMTKKHSIRSEEGEYQGVLSEVEVTSTVATTTAVSSVSVAPSKSAPSDRKSAWSRAKEKSKKDPASWAFETGRKKDKVLGLPIKTPEIQEGGKPIPAATDKALAGAKKSIAPPPKKSGLFLLDQVFNALKPQPGDQSGTAKAGEKGGNDTPATVKETQKKSSANDAKATKAAKGKEK